jgi:hypothetical protein
MCSRCTRIDLLSTGCVRALSSTRRQTTPTCFCITSATGDCTASRLYSPGRPKTSVRFKLFFHSDQGKNEHGWWGFIPAASFPTLPTLHSFRRSIPLTKRENKEKERASLQSTQNERIKVTTFGTDGREMDAGRISSLFLDPT